jgi:dolichyl-phosphate-mannose--protein O-mannosyl transferase
MTKGIREEVEVYCWGCGLDYLTCSRYTRDDLTFWDIEDQEECPLCPDCVDQMVSEGRLALG